jgi:catalase
MNRQSKADDPLSLEVLQAFEDLEGYHPGFRPAHAKGILLSGKFTPSSSVRELTKAPHVSRPSTPIVVRFSDFAGIPIVADNDQENASPRGIAIRFNLAEHVHTDIIGHSVNGFPTRTVEEFVQFLRALGASGPGAPKPTPIEAFLGAHPAALAFVQTPKPIPTSFAKESFFAVNAYRFINAAGTSKFGRYRIVPQDSNEYLESSALAKKSPNFLFDDIRDRIGHGAVTMRIMVQVASDGDVVDDSTIHWPEKRPLIEFGKIELNEVVPDQEAEQRQIIFDPIPRVDGIEPSNDPLLEPRAALYLTSGRRRRAATEATRRVAS